MKTLEEKSAYTFLGTGLCWRTPDPQLLCQRASGGPASNERLEFLGDSILGLVVADHLYRTRPDLPEGDLTRIRAALVCEGSLVQVAKSLDLGSYLKLGKGEAHGGGRARPSIQADAVEAMLAAVYLDGGIGQARKLIHDLVLTDEKEKTAAGRDFKTALQELVQRESGPGPGLSSHRRERPGPRQDLLHGGPAQRQDHRGRPGPQQERGRAGRRQGSRGQPGTGQGMNKNKRNIIIAVVLLILLCIAPFWPNIKQAVAPDAISGTSVTTETEQPRDPGNRLRNVRDEAGFLRSKGAFGLTSFPPYDTFLNKNTRKNNGRFYYVV